MEPIKFLVITSRPLINEKEQPLRLVNVTQARHRLRTGLEAAQIPVQVRFVAQACSDIVRMCAQDDFDVLHYFGHGSEDGYLCFEDEWGMVHSVDPTSFIQVLGLNRSPKPTPREVLQSIDDLTGEPAGVWTSLGLSFNDLNEEQKKLFRD